MVSLYFRWPQAWSCCRGRDFWPQLGVRNFATEFDVLFWDILTFLWRAVFLALKRRLIKIICKKSKHLLQKILVSPLYSFKLRQVHHASDDVFKRLWLLSFAHCFNIFSESLWCDWFFRFFLHFKIKHLDRWLWLWPHELIFYSTFVVNFVWTRFSFFIVLLV